jgi:hypothetical protein
VNARRPMVCSSSCATTTSWCAMRPARASARCGWCRRCLPAAARPARRSRRRCPCCPCRPRSGPGAGRSRARGQVAVDRDQLLHAADLGRTARCARAAGPVRRRAAESSAERISASRSTAPASQGSARFGVLVHQPRGQAWSSEPQLAPIRTGLPYGSRTRSAARTGCRASARSRRCRG